MTKKQMKETIQNQYMAAIHEAEKAKKDYMQALNDGAEGLRKLSFRDDFIAKRQYMYVIEDLAILLKLMTIEELQEVKNQIVN